jgi:hypothetical protein
MTDKELVSQYRDLEWSSFAYREMQIREAAAHSVEHPDIHQGVYVPFVSTESYVTVRVHLLPGMRGAAAQVLIERQIRGQLGADAA